MAASVWVSALAPGAVAQTASVLPAGEAGAQALGLGQAQIDEVALPATDMLLATQLPDGTFMDPLRGPVGGSGLTRVVWVALRQASRLSGEAAQDRIRAAALSLQRGTELSQVLPKWVLALVFSDRLQSLLPSPQALEAEEANLGRLHASGTADPCFQKPGCFNNYVLAGQLLNLELAHSGLRPSDPAARLAHRSGRARSRLLLNPPRLANPHLVADTLRWMGRSLPRTTSESAVVRVPGLGKRTGAALSDPSTYPLAYQALCTALLTRAVYLAGRRAPAGMLRLELAALWELVGVTAPNGEVSWMGRGQDIVWTLASSFYAAMQGSVLVQRLHPDLAARLRRLAQIDLQALRLRIGAPAFRARPIAGVPGAQGIDTYYGPVGTGSLALVWVELAREVAPFVSGPAAPLPSEQQNAWLSDPRSSAVLALRRARVWLGVSARRAGTDARTGWGLLRALRLAPDGTWQALLPDRPLLPRYRPEPAAGPLLVGAHGAVAEPRTLHQGVGVGGIELSGTWGAGKGAVHARWSWAPAGSGVGLTSTCPRGRRLRFVEWLPVRGLLVRGATWIARGAFAVHFSLPVAVRALSGRYASAREDALAAYRVTVACTGALLHVVWTGGEPAPA